MRGLTELPILAPESLLGSAPLQPPSSPVRFTLAGSLERERPTLLRECFARLGLRYAVDPLPDEPLQVDLALTMLPGLMIGMGQLHGSRNRRTRAHVEDDTDDIGLVVNLRGRRRIEQGNEDLVLADGEAVFVSRSKPSSHTHRAPGDVLVLRFPRAQFAPLTSGVDERCMKRITSDVAALRFLKSYVDVARDEQVTASREMQRLVVNHIYDLMAVMIGATRDAAHAAQDRGIRAARLQAIKQDIEKSLDRPDLSVRILARRHGCTARLIQRLFEADGTTFTEYVLAQRLARAYRVLSDPRSQANKISAVAMDSGFGDLSYFNRMFRRRYGAAPSDIRAQARQYAVESRM